MSDKYEGWANRSTWAVWIWLNNDQGLYSMVMEAPYQGRADMADYIESIIDELVSEAVTKIDPVSADLLNGALVSVDWRELAEAWLQEKD